MTIPNSKFAMYENANCVLQKRFAPLYCAKLQELRGAARVAFVAV